MLKRLRLHGANDVQPHSRGEQTAQVIEEKEAHRGRPLDAQSFHHCTKNAGEVTELRGGPTRGAKITIIGRRIF